MSLNPICVRIIACFVASLSLLDCYGRKVLGQFDELTIGSEYSATHTLASNERIKTELCDKTFLNAFQVGIHGAKTDVLREALKKEMERDPKIIAFLDVHFEHSGGCWKIEYTPERKKK
ncbi:hypothetical protein LEP1GSC047_3607 [Leptospira inadai serovar Lyme str. 10]|uniref:Uncharacterized protein n=2 Tax=Leptospira inadai serovar Lyme TaxID=293084 RepID=V6HBX1_9LEPT|nr:hypothetical protein [Leptospira inadai]EQA37246.1 hypothetical protein LEP1GSC047_3607 [Leptospira inadai serovar Lyme str. 10]PNV74965.1 hypothetical protein BES34_010340 [Leptospira inadai serovar Lyme]